MKTPDVTAPGQRVGEFHETSRIYIVNPVQDIRWVEFITGSARASVFHSAAWLNALKQTYGFEPIVYTHSPPGVPLKDGVVFCRVNSWLTGRRLVSLPFSDHCEPLTDGIDSLTTLLADARADLSAGKYKFVELRPLSPDFVRLAGEFSESYYLHILDLSPSIEILYKNLHVDSIRRKIQKAEREHLSLELGSCDSLLAEFYKLHVATRQKQQLPPHPLNWFRNVLDSMGNDAAIRVAKKGGEPIAAIFTISAKQKVIYKYGCSEPRFHNLGGMQFLFWELIKDSKQKGFLELDFGRSERDNVGLVTFKDRWGTKRQEITYLRYPPRKQEASGETATMRVGKQLFAHCPKRILRLAGKLLYPHFG